MHLQTNGGGIDMKSFNEIQEGSAVSQTIKHTVVRRLKERKLKTALQAAQLWLLMDNVIKLWNLDDIKMSYSLAELQIYDRSN